MLKHKTERVNEMWEEAVGEGRERKSWLEDEREKLA